MLQTQRSTKKNDTSLLSVSLERLGFSQRSLTSIFSLSLSYSAHIADLQRDPLRHPSNISVFDLFHHFRVIFRYLQIQTRFTSLLIFVYFLSKSLSVYVLFVSPIGANFFRSLSAVGDQSPPAFKQRKAAIIKVLGNYPLFLLILDYI